MFHCLRLFTTAHQFAGHKRLGPVIGAAVFATRLLWPA